MVGQHISCDIYAHTHAVPVSQSLSQQSIDNCNNKATMTRRKI